MDKFEGGDRNEMCTPMASVLLTDPVLQWLSPVERHRLRGINKQHNDVIDGIARTQKHYTVPMKTTLSWRGREALYASYPSIQDLTFECGGPDRLDTYLRPNLQSLHLRVPLLLSCYPDSPDSFVWDNADDIAQELRALETFLEANPEAKLQSLRITFHDTVRLTMVDGNSMVVDYDRGGPIFEDYDYSIEDSYGAAEVYFALIEQTPEMELLAEKIQTLSQVRPWKHFSLPAELPGASTVPFATLSEPCDKDDDAIESLWEHIAQLRYMQQN